MVETGEELIVVSIYAQAENPVPYRRDIYHDASMHRLLSDLSPLLSYRRLPVVVAGDFNSVLGWKLDEPGADWTARNTGVFERLSALGLHLAGPQAPNGEQAVSGGPRARDSGCRVAVVS